MFQEFIAWPFASCDRSHGHSHQDPAVFGDGRPHPSHAGVESKYLSQSHIYTIVSLYLDLKWMYLLPIHDIQIDILGFVEDLLTL